MVIYIVCAGGSIDDLDNIMAFAAKDEAESFALTIEFQYGIVIIESMVVVE